MNHSGSVHRCVVGRWDEEMERLHVNLSSGLERRRQGCRKLHSSHTHCPVSVHSWLPGKTHPDFLEVLSQTCPSFAGSTKSSSGRLTNRSEGSRLPEEEDLLWSVSASETAWQHLDRCSRWSRHVGCKRSSSGQELIFFFFLFTFRGKLCPVFPQLRITFSLVNVWVNQAAQDYATCFLTESDSISELQYLVTLL